MGVNPGHIKEIVKLNISRPRTFKTSLDPEFQVSKIKILESIREETLKIIK